MGEFLVFFPGAVPVLRLTMAALRADLRADSPLMPGTWNKFPSKDFHSFKLSGSLKARVGARSASSCICIESTIVSVPLSGA